MSTIGSERSPVIEPRSLGGLEVAISRIQQRPASIHLLYGHSQVYTAALLVGSTINQPLAVIDGGMKFNSYTLSRIAAFLALPPKTLLRRTYLTRSFTAFQTEAAITTKLLRFLNNTPCRLVVILGLLDTYYDEQIKPLECQRSLRRILQTLRELTARNIHILIADAKVGNVPPGKEMLFHLIHHASDVVIRLENGVPFQESMSSPNAERRILLWDETTIPSLSSSIETERHGVNSEEH